MARVFGIELQWLSEPLEVFELLLSGAREQSPWERLLRVACQDGAGTIEQIAPPADQVLIARPASSVRPLPVIDRGALIAVKFNLPPGPSSRENLWTHWYATLLSSDGDGFLCVLPRYLGSPEFPHQSHTRFGVGPVFECSGLQLDHQVGVHSLVLIAHEKPLPEALHRLLLLDREGEALLPTLDLLANHLLPLCTPAQTLPGSGSNPATAALHRLSFKVL